jgi:flagellar basal body-associated protein FliL
MFLILCVVIVLTVITVGLVLLWSQKSKESPKRNESMPEEKEFEGILSFINSLRKHKEPNFF